MDARKPIPGSAWVVAGLTIIASAGLGFILGGLAQLLYGFERFAGGWASGGVLGTLVGLGYVITLVRQRIAGTRDGYFVLWGTLAGIVAGVVAAAGVHGVLMCAVPRWAPDLLGIGVLFGVGAGAVLGLISSSLFCWCFKAGHDSN